MLIQLTNERWDKFYLNTELIETIHPLMGNKSEIRLTTGRHVVCIESAKEIKQLSDKIEELTK